MSVPPSHGPAEPEPRTETVVKRYSGPRRRDRETQTSMFTFVSYIRRDFSKKLCDAKIVGCYVDILKVSVYHNIFHGLSYKFSSISNMRNPRIGDQHILHLVLHLFTLYMCLIGVTVLMYVLPPIQSLVSVSDLLYAYPRSQLRTRH